MNIQVQVIEGPLARCAAPSQELRESVGALGAWVCFEGIVRAQENGRTIRGLEYQAYEPMASRLLIELADAVSKTHGLLGVRVFHSRGYVGVGACSFRLEILAAHRKPALAAMDEFIDRMKRDVPIWKSPVWDE